MIAVLLVVLYFLGFIGACVIAKCYERSTVHNGFLDTCQGLFPIAQMFWPIALVLWLAFSFLIIMFEIIWIKGFEPTVEWITDKICPRKDV